MRTIVIAALVAAAGLMPSASAAPLPDPEPPASCSIATSGARSCEFTCLADGEVGASLDVTHRSLGISGSCGGASVGCETTTHCNSTATAEAAGVGICQFSPSGGGSGTGSCYGKPPESKDPPPEKCIDLVILCIEPPGGIAPPGTITPPRPSPITAPCSPGGPSPKEFAVMMTFVLAHFLPVKEGGC